MSPCFASIGLPLEEPLVRTLYRNGFDDPTYHVLIQSFEVGNLRALSRMTDVRLIQLLDHPDTAVAAVNAVRRRRQPVSVG